MLSENIDTESYAVASASSSSNYYVEIISVFCHSQCSNVLLHIIRWLYNSQTPPYPILSKISQLTFDFSFFFHPKIYLFVDALNQKKTYAGPWFITLCLCFCSSLNNKYFMILFVLYHPWFDFIVVAFINLLNQTHDTKKKCIKIKTKPNKILHKHIHHRHASSMLLLKTPNWFKIQ